MFLILFLIVNLNSQIISSGVTDYIYVETDSLEILQDKNEASAFGNVVVQREDLTLKSQIAYIKEKDGKIFIIAKDSVTITKTDLSLKSNEIDAKLFENNYEIKASSNVEVILSTVSITSEKVQLDSFKKEIITTGKTEFYDIYNFFSCDSLSYNWETTTATILNTRFKSARWNFYGKETSKESEKKYNLKKAAITSCDLSPPHYHFKTDNVSVVIDDKFKSRNDVLYIGKVPIFFLPRFSRSLKGKGYVTYFRPGYSVELGAIFKTTWLIPYIDEKNFYQKIYLDWYTARGVGFGTELNYSDNVKKGSLYTYYTKENYEDKKLEKKVIAERWNLYVAHQQNFGKYWNLQLNGNFYSDWQFTNYYFRESWTRTNPNVNSNISITRNTSKTVFRTSIDRTDIAKSTETILGSFIPQKINYRISMQLLPYRIFKTPLLFNSGLDLLRSMNRTQIANDFKNVYANSCSFSNKLYAELKSPTNTIFVPSFQITTNWYDRVLELNTTEYFINFYTSNLLIRQKILRNLDWDWNYIYITRSVENSLKQDLKSSDKGITSNKLTTKFEMRPLFFIGGWSRISTGYNFPLINQKKYDKKNLDPLIFEIDLLPFKFFENYIRFEFIHSPQQLRSLTLDSTLNFLTPIQKTIKFGLTYSPSTQIDTYELRQSFTFPFLFFYVDFSIKERLTHNKILKTDEFLIWDKEIRAILDLHCWEGNLIFRERPGVQEFIFQLRLALEPQARKKEIQRIEQESQWYQWRK